jgi:hypothetical protein
LLNCCTRVTTAARREPGAGAMLRIPIASRCRRFNRRHQYECGSERPNDRDGSLATSSDPRIHGHFERRLDVPEADAGNFDLYQPRNRSRAFSLLSRHPRIGAAIHTFQAGLIAALTFCEASLASSRSTNFGECSTKSTSQ